LGSNFLNSDSPRLKPQRLKKSPKPAENDPITSPGRKIRLLEKFERVKPGVPHIFLDRKKHPMQAKTRAGAMALWLSEGNNLKGGHRGRLLRD